MTKHRTEPAAPSRAGRLQGSVALVTGASRGIGRAIAEAFAAEGAKLCLVATDAARLREVAAGLSGCPEPAMRLQADVTDRAACFDVVAEVQARFGHLDVLVNNAGVYLGKSFLEHTPEEFQRLLDVNLFGVIHLTQAALPGMLARGYGRIVNIASTAGKWGSRNQSGYNVSKHAVVGLTRCVALETAARGVTVNAICPGIVGTDMADSLKRGQAALMGVDPDAAMAATLAARVPVGRVLEPREVADLAVHLASRASGGMTGQSILVDGGMLLV
jgi:NAD(P)-dependent dehydrogenase (short-subunit alcohol dehydrogenase family)